MKKRGTERNFAVVVLLSVVTFGIYGIYWLYMAHHEVWRQFELEKDDRSEGVVWLIMGLLFSPLRYVYYWVFAQNLNYVRQRLGLQGGITPGTLLGLTIGAGVVGFMSVMAFYAPIVAAEATEASEEELLQAMLGGFGLLMGGLLVAGVLLLIAFGRLQASINEVWRCFDDKVAGQDPGSRGDAATPEPYF